MKYHRGSFSTGSTGNYTVTIPNIPDIAGFRITVGQLFSGPENDVAHFSEGGSDGTNSWAHSIMVTDQLIPITRLSTTYCVTHYDINSNLTYRRISGTLGSIGTSGSDGTITINYDRASVNYQQFIEVWGD